MATRFRISGNLEPPLGSNQTQKSKRPNGSSFRQQKLPAWQPAYTAGAVIPAFFIIGIAFIPIGIGMLWFSESVMEKIIPYTDCKNGLEEMCKDVIRDTSIIDRKCVCIITFEIESDWKGRVFISYGLNNYYQNHRRYMRSRNDQQLAGEFDNDQLDTDDCSPYQDCGGSADTCCNGASGIGLCGNKLPNKTLYLPCGAVANSLFTDVISLR